METKYSEWLKSRMKSEGRSVEWLAEKVGVSKQAIYQYRTTDSEPSKPVRKLIDQYLNVTN